MRSLFPLILFAIVVVGIGFFFKGHSNSVNLYHICDLEVPWYDAVFLDAIKDKSGCERYQ
ncbi:hypothetical protein [Halochromatium roseum]|uniref:hypothetical protein n=1 Tax=Halochromatium roseum TaxID=391920 RepID=UPI001913C5BB|nr:hypothetical protein [Halochromatium roseum]MBK5938744.1 hypothetical protein [Halochromatium roseum]